LTQTDTPGQVTWTSCQRVLGQAVASQSAGSVVDDRPSPDGILSGSDNGPRAGVW